MMSASRGTRTSAPFTSAADQPQQFQIQLAVAPGAHLGIRLKGGHDGRGGQLGIFVFELVPGCVAERQGGLARGDRLLAVNGHSLAAVSNLRAVELLRQAAESGSVQLLVARSGGGHHAPAPPPAYEPARLVRGTPQGDAASNGASSEDDHARPPASRRRLPPQPTTPSATTSSNAAAANRWPLGTQIVELPTHPSGLGVTVGASSTSDHVRILSVAADSVAGRDGRLQVGDCILAVNGRSLKNMPTHEVIERLGAAKGPNTLQQESVTLPLNGRAPGLSFASDDYGRVRIAAIVPGSPAEGTVLTVGAEVVSLNGQAVRNPRDAKRLIMRSTTSREPLTLVIKTGRLQLAVLPKALAERGAVADGVMSPTSSFSSATEDMGRRPASMLRLDDLIEALVNSQSDLSMKQEAQIRQLSRPNAEGLVTRAAFEAAVNQVLYTQPPPIPTPMPAPPSMRMPTTSVSQRAAATRFARRHYTDSEAPEMDVDDLQHQRDDAVRNQQFSTQAQQKSRRLEMDYDEIVALLEAEIAHLRAQLRAGPDEKDQQLINLRRRVLVLSTQLNKAVHAKHTTDLALHRLQDLINRTLRRLVHASAGGPRFPDKALSLREDNTLRYRPSEGPLPPTVPWAVGDVCCAPSLQTGAMVPAVIEHIQNSNRPGMLEARVRFLQYDDIPIVEVVTTDMLEPLDDGDFVVSAARRAAGNRGDAWAADAFNTAQGALTSTERAIYDDCRESLNALAVLLDQDVLPFGWEEAYTADGLKYYIDHTTQTTSWLHPVRKIDKNLAELDVAMPSRA